MVLKIFLPVLLAASAWAQTLELRQVGPYGDDAVEIAVVAELGPARASGISFYIGLPVGAFEVLSGERPFVQGPLMAPAVEFANEQMPEEKAVGAPEGVVLLPYAAVRGPGNDRGRTGAGEVARFVLRPLLAGPLAVELIHTPIYQSKLVLDDGIGEMAFETLDGLVVDGVAVEAEKPADDGRRGWAEIKAGALAR